MNITLNLDTIGYKDKATAKRYIGAICNRTKNAKRIVTITPEQLITEIEKGITFTPGELTGTTANDWRSQQIVAADMDNDKNLLDENNKPVMKDGKEVKVPCEHIIAPEEALEILHANNLDPYFMYYSLSNTPELPKYRIIFILSEKLTDGEETKKLTRKLAHLFKCSTGEPNADTSIENLDRMLLGSKPSSVFYNSGTVTDKSAFDGLIDPDEEPDKDTPINVQAKRAWDNENAEEKARLDRDIESFDLVEYIQSTYPGCTVKHKGKNIFVNPCPVCGHNDDFRIKPNRAFWACFGGTTSESTNGSIIDLLMEAEHKTLPEALDFFKHAIMRYPRSITRTATPAATPTNSGGDPREAAPVEVVPTDVANATKEELFSVDFVKSALAGKTPAEQEAIKETLVDRAKELKKEGVSVTAVKSFVSKIIKELNKRNNNQEIADKITGYTEFKHKTLKKPLYIGENFVSEDGKIYGVKTNGRTGLDELVLICPCMVYPLERLCNIDTNKERITFTFCQDGKWIEKTVDKLTIANHSKAVELSDYGLPITSINAKGFVSYMSAIEYMNADIPRISTTKHFGWAQYQEGTPEFIPYSRKIKFDGEDEYKDLAKAIKPHGDKEKWFALVRRIRSKTNKQYMPQLFMSAALASVLVELLNMLPIWANIWGLTGRGKTANLRLCASIWGNPGESKYIMDGDTTATALFIKASVLKHLPLCIDDFSKIDPQRLTIESLIYTLCSGTDRARATGKEVHLREVHTWKNAILTTFERPLIDENMKGGAINRVLDFGITNEDIFENPGEIFETVQNNYGFLGPMFIEKVLELGVAKVAEIQKDFTQQIFAAAAELGEKKEAKQVLPLSVILTADKIATEIFGDRIYLNVKQLTRHLKSTNEVSDGQRAYEHLMDYIAMNTRNFINLDRMDIDTQKPFNPGVEVYGSLGHESTTKYVYFNGLQLERAFNNTNYNTKVFLSWLREKQLIKLPTKGFMSVKTLMGHPQKVYAIRIQEEQEDNSEEVPF